MEIYELNLRIQSEYGKIQNRNNSVFGHFSCGDIIYKTHLDYCEVVYDQPENVSFIAKLE